MPNNKMDFSKYRFGYLGLCILMCFVSCKDTAILEPVTNPKAIRPEILLYRSLNNESSPAYSKSSVRLKNRQGQSVEIEGGQVRVNGHLMAPPVNFLGNSHDDYILEDNIVSDQLYTIEVTFTDGEIYEAWVESPDITLSQMDIPLKVKRKTALTLTWSQTDYRYPQYIALQYFDALDQFSPSHETKLDIYYPYLGSYELNKKYILYHNESETLARELRVKLIAETTGAMDKRFLSGGWIRCQIKIFQDIEVY